MIPSDEFSQILATLHSCYMGERGERNNMEDIKNKLLELKIGELLIITKYDEYIRTYNGWVLNQKLELPDGSWMVTSTFVPEVINAYCKTD